VGVRVVSTTVSARDQVRTQGDKSVKIYVGNLSFNTTEDQLRGVFEEHGEVESCALITDRDSGRSKGFAFIEMPNADQAKTAMDSMNGSDLDDRTLTVNEARPKTDNRGGGYGGGGGGGFR